MAIGDPSAEMSVALVTSYRIEQHSPVHWVGNLLSVADLGDVGGVESGGSGEFSAADLLEVGADVGVVPVGVGGGGWASPRSVERSTMR